MNYPHHLRKKLGRINKCHGICSNETSYSEKKSNMPFIQRHRVIQILEPYIDAMNKQLSCCDVMTADQISQMAAILSCRH